VISLAVDEDFDLRAIHALRRRVPALDVALVRDAAGGAPDPVVLEWAARQSRVLLTRDRKTLLAHACERIERGLYMPGVLAVQSGVSFANIVDDLELVVVCGVPEDFDGRIEFLPL
jgi:hypothetical protein